MTEQEIVDVAIIGGGPVGLFGSFYAGMRGMSTKIIDSLPELGGQLTALYPEKYIFDMPGFPKVLAKSLANDMVEQGLKFNPTVCLDETVNNIRRREDGIWETVTNHATHPSRTVLVCAGAGAFSPKKLSIIGLEHFEGKHVFYFVKDKNTFAGKRVLIVGGGDSALDWAMNLEPVAAKITQIHRRDVFRAHEESVDWLFNRSKVELHLWCELKELRGNDHLEDVIYFNNKSGEETVLPVDYVLINIGFNASLGPIKDWGLKFENGAIAVNTHMETNLPGVYAAGDICTYDGKLKLIATGVGEVCIAVNYAKTFIDPTAKVFPGHSSGMNL